MKYHIITYGCQMNKANSERIAEDLKNKSYKPTPNINRADLIVVNMCSVRQSAVDRVYGLSLKFKNLKAKKILTGCILKKDRVKFKKFFDEIKKMQQLSCPSALIPISNGCNNFCTYCVVPYTRGPLTCRNPKEILREARGAIKKGFKEIWLLGQNVNDYSPIPFTDLLKKVAALPGDFKIRFTSPHPVDFSDELIETIAQCEKIAKYIHLPIQSGDDKILKKMNRNYTVRQYKELVKKIRKKIPDINLSTDVIVGFPGETKKQFENTVKLFREIKFDMAYIAKYSPRPGTAASHLKDNIPLEEKKRREKCLRKFIK
jgi:tRNA-2-methylthio-N6-dimethylallyladenosine synthase